jgi:hypothetical protein
MHLAVVNRADCRSAAGRQIGSRERSHQKGKRRQQQSQDSYDRPEFSPKSTHRTTRR